MGLPSCFASVTMAPGPHLESPEVSPVAVESHFTIHKPMVVEKSMAILKQFGRFQGSVSFPPYGPYVMSIQGKQKQLVTLASFCWGPKGRHRLFLSDGSCPLGCCSLSALCCRHDPRRSDLDCLLYVCTVEGKLIKTKFH